MWVGLSGRSVAIGLGAGQCERRIPIGLGAGLSWKGRGSADRGGAKREERCYGSGGGAMQIGRGSANEGGAMRLRAGFWERRVAIGWWGHWGRGIVRAAFLLV